MAVERFEVLFEALPIVVDVPRKYFNEVLSVWSIIERQVDAALPCGQPKCVALDVPATKELSDVCLIEEKRAGLARARHD